MIVDDQDGGHGALPVVNGRRARTLVPPPGTRRSSACRRGRRRVPASTGSRRRGCAAIPAVAVIGHLHLEGRVRDDPDATVSCTGWRIAFVIASVAIR